MARKKRGRPSARKRRSSENKKSARSVFRPRTRDRLLEVACKRFAEKGYRATRTQDICEDAEANIAAVNYHFGGKRGLYKAVWDHALEQSVRHEEASLKFSSSEDREWLYRYTHACVTSVFDNGMGGILRRLMVHEISEPSPDSKEILLSHVAPHSEELMLRLRRMLGENVTDYQIGCCVFAIHSLFSALAFNRDSTEVIFRNTLPRHEEVDQFVREICAFIMGGIRAIRAVPPASVPASAAVSPVPTGAHDPHAS